MSTTSGGGGKKASTAAAATSGGSAESPYLRRIMERRTAASSAAEGGHPPFPSSYPPIEGSSMDMGLGGPGTDSREGRKDPLSHLSLKLFLFSLNSL